MDNNTLTRLISEHETHQVEFKKSTSELEKAGRSLCAFLNSNGGHVLIGVTDQKKCIGQVTTEKTRLDIDNLLKHFEPIANIEVEFIDVPGTKHKVIALQARPDISKVPYTYKGRACERGQASTLIMPQARYQQLLFKRHPLNLWEGLSVGSDDIALLDESLILQTIHRGIEKNRIPPEAEQESVRTLLTNRLGLIADDGSLTRAAILLFGNQVSRFARQCSMRLAVFNGKDKLCPMLDQRTLIGNIFVLLDEAVHFCLRHVPVGGYLDTNKLHRVDTPALPQLAIREILLNSLCHRDYSILNSDSSVAIFSDRIVVWNIGGLPEGITIECLKSTHDSVRRNPVIAEVLNLCGLVEKWGTGTTRVHKLCEESQCPEPAFEEHSGGLQVTLFFNPALLSQNESKSAVQDAPLNHRQQAIVDLLRVNGPLSARNIRSYLIEPPSERTIRADLYLLKKQGIISSSGRSISARWFISE